MAVRLGEIMEELEQQDHAAGDELNPVPSWIRAHFVLEQEFEQINARQQELEAAMSDADNQRMQARVCAMPYAKPCVEEVRLSRQPNLSCLGCLSWGSIAAGMQWTDTAALSQDASIQNLKRPTSFNRRWHWRRWTRRWT